jgi:hypothetical protein
VSNIWFLCPQGRLQLRLEVTHCQFMQGFHICFIFAMQQLCCYTAATLASHLLPLQCGAIQFSALPSVSGDQLRDPPPAPLWEVGLLSHPCSQPLLLFSPLFSECLAPCPTPVFWGRFSVPPHPHCQCYITICCLCFSVLLGGFNLPRGCAGLCSQRMYKGLACGGCCSPVGSAGLCRKF